jgi:hypothetical protein
VPSGVWERTVFRPGMDAEMSEVMRYRKKPVVIEAVLLTGRNRHAVAGWCGGEAPLAGPSGTVYAPGLVSITTLEGTMWAGDGDYVIRGVKGEFYPCKPDIFEATYEPVGDDQ